MENKENKEKPELPPLTVTNLAKDAVHVIRTLIFDPNANRLVIPMVVIAASILGKVVMAKVNYTEIDFSTYMQQVEAAQLGELDYSKITGDTGPVVYPAGFLQVYGFLHWVTSGGSDLRAGQLAFSYLFTLSVAMTCAVYSMLGRIRPWCLYLLIASRRLVSIYVLRLFNDCFTTAAMIGVVLVLQLAAYWSHLLSPTLMFLANAVAADLFSMAISVKMNALLYLPAFMVVSYFLLRESLVHLAAVFLVIPLVQVLTAWKYLLPFFWDSEASYIRWTYLANAFNFKRKFLYEWTVNWRFFSEDTFISDAFANALLVGHVCVLLVFVITRFVSPRVTGKSVLKLVKDAFNLFSATAAPENLYLLQKHGPRLVLLVFATTNTIGVLFARSLHYQFLAWYCWLLPFLIHATNIHPLPGVFIFLVHEWCWNVFPSTESSSAVLICSLVMVIAGVWANTTVWFGKTKNPNSKDSAKDPAQLPKDSTQSTDDIKKD